MPLQPRRLRSREPSAASRDAGTLRGRRFVQGGRASVRAVLYMAALVAAKRNAVIHAFYQSGSILHLPRDEDGTLVSGVFNGTAQVMWTGWMLKPHNLFDKVPLFP
ncbi:MAG: hypothetical protein ABR543_03735 [Gemmatimonadaceae bacterium]